MKGQTCYSYAMGFDENVLMLERNGFEIKKDGENYCVSFGIDLADTWEEFVRTNLKNGYRNEYLIGENAVFIFNTDSGIRRYEVQRYKNAEVLRLCREMSGHSFRSIRSMLRGNGFYKNKIGIFGTRKF